MLGTVIRLRRYPVKSMLGEDVDATDVSWTGLARDRRLAVVSRTTGKIASAKYPRLWRDLLTASGAASGDAVRITLPGGQTVWSTDAEVDALLSELLDEPHADRDQAAGRGTGPGRARGRAPCGHQRAGALRG